MTRTSTDDMPPGWLGIARRGASLLAIGFLVDAAFMFVFLVALQTYLPESLHASAALAGYALAAFGFSKLVTQIAGGVVTDRLGSRRALIAGTGLYFVANATIWPLAHAAPWAVVAAAVLYGFGSSFTWPPVYTLAAESFEPHERARLTSALTLVTALALVAGLGGGALLNATVSFDVAMIFPLGAAAIAFVIALRTRVRGERAPAEERGRPSLRELPAVLRSMPRLAFSIIIIAESSALGAVAAVFRAYGRDVVGVSLIREALLLAPAAALGALCVPLGGIAGDRYGARRLLVPGFAVSGLCVLAMSQWSAQAYVVLVAALAGASFALAVPSMSASMMALAGPLGMRGGVIGWFMTADGLGQSVGPAVAAMLIASGGARYVLALIGALFLTVAALAAVSPLAQPEARRPAISRFELLRARPRRL